MNRVLDLPLVIDAMLTRNATSGDLLFGSMDPHRIGISGESTGGGTALRVAGGWSENGIVADPRIKAMVVYEPTPFFEVDVSTISLPYMVMSGTQSAVSQTIPSLFETTVLATRGSPSRILRPSTSAIKPESAHALTRPARPP
jgi:hypothetical protein